MILIHHTMSLQYLLKSCKLICKIAAYIAIYTIAYIVSTVYITRISRENLLHFVVARKTLVMLDVFIFRQLLIAGIIYNPSYTIV